MIEKEKKGKNKNEDDLYIWNIHAILKDDG